MPKIETSLLTRQVYGVLREKIIAGEYKPGDRLDIIKLAEEFGVSRSPVKSAVDELVYEGLIEIIPRKGTYVTKLDLVEFQEILEARLMIELWAIHHVIENIETCDLEPLKETIHEMDALLETSPFLFDDYNQLDLQFHSTIIKWTGNNKVHDLFTSLNTHVFLSRIVHSTSLDSTMKRHQDHATLYEALKAGDKTMASEAITAHLLSIKEEAETRWEQVNE